MEKDIDGTGGVLMAGVFEQYHCKDCGSVFELGVITESDYDVTYCPLCGSEALEVS